jgi:hypothetical protein
MGAEHGRHPSVEVEAEGLLFAGGLGVEVDQDDVDVRRQRGEEAVGDAEGRVHLLHEHLPLEVDRRHADPRRRLAEVDAASRIAVGIVGRAQQPGLAVEERKPLLLVPDVIAGSEAVDRQVGELGKHLGVDAETAGGVLDVDDDVVDAMVVDQARQQPLHGSTARLADHVADEEEDHAAALLAIAPAVTEGSLAALGMTPGRWRPDITWRTRWRGSRGSPSP